MVPNSEKNWKHEPVEGLWHSEFSGGGVYAEETLWWSGLGVFQGEIQGAGRVLGRMGGHALRGVHFSRGVVPIGAEETGEWGAYRSALRDRHMVVALGEGGQVVVGVQNCDAQLFKKKTWQKFSEVSFSWTYQNVFEKMLQSQSHNTK